MITHGCPHAARRQASLISDLLRVKESSAASHKCHFRVRHFGRVLKSPYKKSCISITWTPSILVRRQLTLLLLQLLMVPGMVLSCAWATVTLDITVTTVLRRRHMHARHSSHSRSSQHFQSCHRRRLAHRHLHCHLARRRHSQQQISQRSRHQPVLAAARGVHSRVGWWRRFFSCLPSARSLSASPSHPAPSPIATSVSAINWSYADHTLAAAPPLPPAAQPQSAIHMACSTAHNSGGAGRTGTVTGTHTGAGTGTGTGAGTHAATSSARASSRRSTHKMDRGDCAWLT